jgi:hypothetical protein
MDVCRRVTPKLEPLADGGTRRVACHLYTPVKAVSEST